MATIQQMWAAMNTDIAGIIIIIVFIIIVQ